MNSFFSPWPLPLQLGLMFLLGTVVAGAVNLAIYRLAWRQRCLSPWGPKPKGVPSRGWLDRMPVLGWIRLRRESAVHGAGFWWRPLLLEICTGIGFAALYWWEVDRMALLPATALRTPVRFVEPVHAVVGLPLVSHIILVSLMLAATFIDIDEKSIPDEITLLGTLVGLLLASVLPWSLLPGGRIVILQNHLPVVGVEFMQIASPAAWPAALLDYPHWPGLAIGLALYGMWCFALLPRTWYGRHGVRRALQLCLARIAREGSSRLIAGLAVVGTAAIVGVWLRGGANWAALLTALVGMAVGGGIIWAVRIIARVVMRREAMGFGDVTLMAMIGSFVGWQACLLIFFLAPLLGILIGVAHWLSRREQEIPFGPFLCLATILVMVGWSPVWGNAERYFAILGPFIPAIMVVCLALMAFLLWLIQVAKRLVWGAH